MKNDLINIRRRRKNKPVLKKDVMHILFCDMYSDIQVDVTKM